MARIIYEDDLEDISRGAAVLGTGGGGNPYVGKLLAQRAIRDCGPVTLVDADEVPADAVVVQAAMMGAPTVMVEKLPRGDEALLALRGLQDFLGKPVTHVVCGEAGGINSTIPFAVAAQAGLPLVDADGMGRAFPELQMLIPGMLGVSATPMVVADEKGNTVLLRTTGNEWTERLARTATIEMGCSALIACYAMSGQQVRDTMVLGTLTLCADLGRIIRLARAAHDDAVRAVADRLDGHLIFQGRVSDIERRTETGFARGRAVLAGTGEWAGTDLVLNFQNEHLVAIRDGTVIASVPDLIIVLNSENAEPITTEEIRYGFRVSVVAAPCDPRWQTAEGLALVGPEYFGYDFPYVSVTERLAAERRPR